MVIVSGGVAAMPRPGDNVVLRDAGVFVTGVGANVAIALRALGVEVALASAVGDDPLGVWILDDLQGVGVDVSLIRRVPATAAGSVTGAMVVMVDAGGERTMVGTRGAAARYDLDPPGALDATGPDWLHVSGYALLDAEMEERCDALVREGEARGIRCSVDLEGIGTSGRRTPLDRVTVLANLDEYRAYLDVKNVEPAPDRSSPLVVKAGTDGCYLVRGEDVRHVPAAAPTPAPAVDSTGAGDAFDAAFIAAALRGLDAEDACRWGNAAGWIAAQRRGPRADLSI